VVDVELLPSERHCAILVLVQICLFLLVHFSIGGGGNVLLDGDYLLCFFVEVEREVLWCCGRESFLCCECLEDMLTVGQKNN